MIHSLRNPNIRASLNPYEPPQSVVGVLSSFEHYSSLEVDRIRGLGLRVPEDL